MASRIQKYMYRKYYKKPINSHSEVIYLFKFSGVYLGMFLNAKHLALYFQKYYEVDSAFKVVYDKCVRICRGRTKKYLQLTAKHKEVSEILVVVNIPVGEYPLDGKYMRDSAEKWFNVIRNTNDSFI
jgi:hypothetical protein